MQTIHLYAKMMKMRFWEKSEKSDRAILLAELGWEVGKGEN